MHRGVSSGTWGRLAACWCVIFAMVHVYWAAGGSFGLAESAGVDLATRRPTAFVLFGLWGVALLLLLSAAGLLIGAVLIVRGVVLSVVLIADAGGVATAVGPEQTLWSLAVWNPWFVIGGVVFLLAATRPHNGCQSSNRFPSRS